MAFNGPPGVDHDGTPLTLHGRIANRSAHDVAVEIDDAEEGSLSLVGVVDETSMFGTNLRLTSRVTLPAGRPVIRIVDEVTQNRRCEHETVDELVAVVEAGVSLRERSFQRLGPPRPTVDVERRGDQLGRVTVGQSEEPACVVGHGGARTRLAARVEVCRSHPHAVSDLTQAERGQVPAQPGPLGGGPSGGYHDRLLP